MPSPTRSPPIHIGCTFRRSGRCFLRTDLRSKRERLGTNERNDELLIFPSYPRPRTAAEAADASTACRPICCVSCHCLSLFLFFSFSRSLHACVGTVIAVSVSPVHLCSPSSSQSCPSTVSRHSQYWSAPTLRSVLVKLYGRVVLNVDM